MRARCNEALCNEVLCSEALCNEGRRAHVIEQTRTT